MLTFIDRHNATIAMCISTQIPDTSLIGFILFGILMPPFPVSACTALDKTKPLQLSYAIHSPSQPIPEGRIVCTGVFSF